MGTPNAFEIKAEQETIVTITKKVKVCLDRAQVVRMLQHYGVSNGIVVPDTADVLFEGRNVDIDSPIIVQWESVDIKTEIASDDDNSDIPF